VDQILLGPVAGQRDRRTVPPGGEKAAAGIALARQPRRQFRGIGKMRPQQRHHRKAGSNFLGGFGVAQDDVAHAAASTGCTEHRPIAGRRHRLIIWCGEWDGLCWDGLCGDADARWLFDALSASPNRRDIKIARATYLMHLETARYALYHKAEAFLLNRDIPPMAEEAAPCSP
jgi:hypothetical protein